MGYKDVPKVGRPRLDDDDIALKKSVVITEKMFERIQTRIAAFGDLSKYVRHLIDKDLGKEGKVK